MQTVWQINENSLGKAVSVWPCCMEGGGSKIASHILHGIYTHWPTQSTTRVEYTFCAYFFMSESLHMFLSCLKNGLLCLQIYLGL